MKYARNAIVFLLLVYGLVFVASAQERIRIGDTVEGEISNGEAVEYLFEAKEGDSLIIDMQGDFDTYLYLLDADGVELVRNDDGGDGTNSRIRGWVAPADGTYIIQADSFGSDASGTFTLSINHFNFTQVTLNESVRAEFAEGINEVYFAFEGESGQVIDVVVDSGGALDTRMEILHPFDYVMDSNLDGDGTVDPSLRSVVLDTTGTYYVFVTRQNPNATLVGSFTFEVNEAELPSLDDGPIDLAFNFEVNQRVFTFEGTAGETVRITVAVDTFSEFASPRFAFMQNAEEFANFSMRGVSQLVTELEVPNDGQVTVNVTAYSEISMNVTLGRPVE